MPASAAVMNPPEQRPKKKRRLAPDAQGSISTRQMDDIATGLEVDHMILDYLFYQAIEACLNQPHTSWNDPLPSTVERTLLQADDFFALFRSRYPNYKFDTEMQFRRDLLQFAALFTQRLRSNSTSPGKDRLKQLREANRERACLWIGEAVRRPTVGHECSALDMKLPLPMEELERNRAQVLQYLGVPAEDEAYEDAFYGTCDSASWLHLLPLFMKVSAACFAIWDVGLSPQWTSMATSLMLLAVVEQYTVYGEDGSDAIDEAFAWGYNPHLEDAEHDKTNTMFEDDGVELPDWKAAREAALSALFGSSEQGDTTEGELVERITDLLDGQAILDCEKRVTTFLRDISQGVAKPVLLQLQQGKLDGMTEEQTQAFVRECGLDVQAFLDQGVLTS